MKTVKIIRKPIKRYRFKTKKELTKKEIQEIGKNFFGEVKKIDTENLKNLIFN